ncbi:hypothetical protein [Ciceribacter sp. RN22]|uniref:hypothetical protein n=1 Tax=Ciceribacter sp. RN22 TaxID=2954932 RepID=UPI002092BDB7|nr:hypothetical protein [Ciceribacter sp. RN22]MCO6177013.1 hypothetical protein [Ciceribacter sp. RN22]
MSNSQQASSCSFYTYVYGGDLTRTSRRFCDTQDMARQDVVTFRRELLAEKDRNDPLPDMKIVRMETVPVTPQALVSLFNDLDGKLGDFIRLREVVEVITEPQVGAGQAGSVD